MYARYIPAPRPPAPRGNPGPPARRQRITTQDGAAGGLPRRQAENVTATQHHTPRTP